MDDEIRHLSTIPDIENFDNIKTTSAVQEEEADSVALGIKIEFESIALPDIKFEHNKTVIIKSSLNGINDVLEFMTKYPSIQIEISGHTDSCGDDEMNMILSTNRALKVKAILIEKGINSDRIISIEFWELFSIVEDSNEENKQKNRRVEFRIL